MPSLANVSGSSPRTISRSIALICAATVLVLATFPAQAQLFTPSVVYTTTFLPTYSQTCPPRLTRLSVTSITGVNGVLSTVFYRTVGVRVRLTSPSGFVTDVPSNGSYNLLSVTTVSNTITVSATDNFPVKGTYRATGAHLLIPKSGNSVVRQTPVSFTN